MVPSFLIDYNQIWSQTLQFFHLCEGAELICSLFMHGSYLAVVLKCDAIYIPVFITFSLA